MNKTNAKHLDAILKELCKQKEKGYLWNNLMNDLGIEDKLSNLYFSKLKIQGYILVNNITKGRNLVRISPEGEAFILTSSFSNRRKKQKADSITNKIVKFFAIAGSVGTLIFGYCNIKINHEINEIRTENKKLLQTIDSLKQANDSLTNKANMIEFKNE